MKIMNPLLDPGLREKFEVVSGDWKKRLLELIPPVRAFLSLGWIRKLANQC